MANKKITELTAVTTLPDAALLTAVDSTRSEGDQNVKITKANLQADLGSTQDLQDVIAQDPVATSVPTFKGGLLVGDAGYGFIGFSDGAFASAGIIVSPTSFLITAESGNYILSKRRLDPINGQIVSVSETGYNASTNNLNLSDSDVEMDGFECVVEVAGTRNFGSGNIVLGVGDVLANNGSIYYKKVDNNQGGGSETATYSATSTAVTTLDCDTFDSRYQILTVNTDFQFSNTPASGETFVKTLEIITTAGETLTFSTADKVTGTLTSDNTTVNLININLANYPTLGLRITVNITQ